MAGSLTYTFDEELSETLYQRAAFKISAGTAAESV